MTRSATRFASVDVKIADAQQRLDHERDMQARQIEAKARTEQADALAAAVAVYDAAAQGLVTALEPINAVAPTSGHFS